MSRFTEDDLHKMGLKRNADGSYSRAATRVQPRDVKPRINTNEVVEIFKQTGHIIYHPDSQVDGFTTITLTLFGEPMPKQSVRSAYDKESGRIHHYQPEKMKMRTEDYRRQIIQQLPKDFKMFTQEVHLVKMHFLFAPLKSFHKVKGKMESIRNGKIYYKNTRPDVSDNLKKLPLDALSGFVFRDDSLIVTENDVAKYYGVGGCIIITLKGK